MNWLFLGLFLIFFSSLALAQTVTDFPIPGSVRSEPVQNFWTDIVNSCTFSYGLDPYIISGLVLKESDFIPTIVNQSEQLACSQGFVGFPCPVPGSGLMQLTGPWVGGTPLPRAEEYQWNMPSEAIRSEAPVVNDLFNPGENLSRGCWYFKALMTRYSNDIVRALAAYRGGFFGVDSGAVHVEPAYDNIVLNYRNLYMASANISEERLQSLLNQIDVNNSLDLNNPSDLNIPSDLNNTLDGNFDIPFNSNLPSSVQPVSDYNFPNGVIPQNAYLPPQEPVPDNRLRLSVVLGLRLTTLGVMDSSPKSYLSLFLANLNNPSLH
ncbi:MAG: transglycosylase SLT domain-containing protein [Candidatus Diapherotrites archaeon]|nr:transglycosylase SLT domain-containing protein [Candidatus Diapherotrites archaeon]